MVTVYFIILSEVNNMEHIFDYNVTVKKFAHFVWPSILMMLMIGLYYNMDSIFVANLVESRLWQRFPWRIRCRV